MSSKRKIKDHPTMIIDISDFKDSYSFVRHDRETNTDIYSNKRTGEEVQLIKYEFFEKDNPLHIHVKNGVSVRKIHSKLENGKEYFNKFLEQTGLPQVTNVTPIVKTTTELNPTLDYFWKIHKNIDDDIYMGYENFNRVSKRSMRPVSRRASHRVSSRALQQEQQEQPEQQVVHVQNMQGLPIHQGLPISVQPIYQEQPMSVQQIHGQPMSVQQIYPELPIHRGQINHGLQMTGQQMQQMQQMRQMQQMQQMQQMRQMQQMQHMRQMPRQPMPRQPMPRQPMPRQPRQPMKEYNDEEIGYFYPPDEDPGYRTRGNTRANSPEPFSQLTSVGGGKIKDKAKKYFYKLLVNPKTIYLKYKEHLYVKFNNYLLSVKKLQEYIYSKDIKQVKNSKKKEEKKI
jgi:hypothetical protein